MTQRLRRLAWRYGVLAALAGPVMASQAEWRVPILVYHRFAATVTDSMTVRSSTFEDHLRVLRSQGYSVIPLHDLLDYLYGRRAGLPAKAVVMTADDGHRSVYQVMYPLVQRYRVPVTLFIYPSAISNASYALTWDELRRMQQSGGVDVQSHSYWHPNFVQERRRLSPQAYRQLVRQQLLRPRQVIEKQLGHKVDLLAWPFGLYDAELMQEAQTAGYLAAFSLEARPVTWRDSLWALPRLLMVDAYDAKTFAALLKKNSQPEPSASHAGSRP